jgi:hypothetical protein
MLGISLALLALTMRVRLEEQQREIRRVRLDLLLDGVMAETLARLAQDPTFSGVDERGEGAGAGEAEGVGQAESAVERQGPQLARVAAAARLGPRIVTASALVQLLPGPPRIVRWRRGPPAGPS